MATLQKFGGNWTEEKLNIFTSYLDSYLIALQNQKFKKIYIDAFAGTGEIETSDGGQYLVGSAKRALASEKKFDHYYFIEADSQKAGELQDMINAEFPQMRQIVTTYCGDANDKLAEIISSVDWRYNRGFHNCQVWNMVCLSHLKVPVMTFSFLKLSNLSVVPVS